MAGVFVSSAVELHSQVSTGAQNNRTVGSAVSEMLLHEVFVAS